MAKIINGILCQEIARKDGLREQIHISQGPSARKGFLCTWGLRYQVINGLLGMTTAFTAPGTGGGNVTVYFPESYPEIPYAYCHNVTVEPVGSPIQGPNQVEWPYCIIWAEYGFLNFIPNQFNQIDPTHPLTYCTQKIQSSCEYITIPGTYLTFATAPNNFLSQNYAFRVALLDIEICFKMVPYLPDQSVFAAAGFINKYAFLGVQPYSLFFNGLTNEPSTRFDGLYTQELKYSFTARSLRWDGGFDVAANRWDQVVDTVGDPIVDSMDFSNLFPTYYQAGVL